LGTCLMLSLAKWFGSLKSGFLPVCSPAPSIRLSLKTVCRWVVKLMNQSPGHWRPGVHGWIRTWFTIF
jgi:hypothetical protein